MRWGVSREAGLVKDKKTTEREPSREVKRKRREEGVTVEVSSLIRRK